jgi:hypothetical protein
MSATFNEIWRELSMYNPDIPPRLVQAWVLDGWKKTRDAKLWSWAVAEDQFETIASVDTGDLTVTNGLDTVVATTSPFVAAHVGQQIKIDNRVFTIDAQSDANNITLDRTWPVTSSSTASGVVLTAYVSAPDDFYGFISVVDTSIPRRIHTQLDPSVIDFSDPRRTRSGQPIALVARKWKTSPSSATTVPMYELWPHSTTLRGLRVLYWKVSADFSKSVNLPHTISDLMIKNYALSRMSKYKGTNANPNPMHSRTAGVDYLNEFYEDLQMAMVNDDEIFDTDLWINTPFVALTDQFLRNHSVNYN